MSAEYMILVMGMGLVSFVPRWIPLFFLSRRKMPALLVEWLDLIPVSILAALLVPYLITAGEPRVLSFTRPELAVAFPTLLVALWTRSLGVTLVAGMVMFWLAGKTGWF
ncbi:branched-subunit amino acid transport protein [Desulfobotulus alkaliphilus]|uniref:Branched-subunit amino acid transport protein n=1 Tax=Desulfobotulus alkaliphilus TaxID=622671 RepID=A0A562S7M3_9BACT|nr:AzlD domain-containing protein [Desulfobotulus alkaliphilus]TWI77412.1 branched-subunit amino acid transport protein [Desulfobotulus alkaliphilus]